MENFDRLFNWFRRSNSGVVSFGLGVISGTLFLGPRNVLPWNLNWLVGKGDGSADQLVFQFFRQTPFFNGQLRLFPITLRVQTQLTQVAMQSFQ